MKKIYFSLLLTCLFFQSCYLNETQTPTNEIREPAAPTETLFNQIANSTITPTVSIAAPCPLPEDWFEYKVVGGDNLFQIARRSGAKIDELVSANCLTDASLIRVGDVLFVPNQITGDGMNMVKFFLIIPDDNGKTAPLVGCGDSGISVWSDRTLSGSVSEDIQSSLQELFAVKTYTYGESGYVNAFYEADLNVQQVIVKDDTAWIDLTGDLLLTGTCADARMEAQIYRTVFQYSGFDRALITLNGKNLKQYFDLSGLVVEDVPYRRSEVR